MSDDVKRRALDAVANRAAEIERRNRYLVIEIGHARREGATQAEIDVALLTSEGSAAKVERRDRYERAYHAASQIHVWTNEDGKRFVFADDLAVALEVPGSASRADRGRGGVVSGVDHERDALDHLLAIGVNDKTVTGPAVIGMEVRSNPQVWETIHAIAARADGTYWVRTFNYTYRSIPTWDLRVAPYGTPEEPK